MIDDFFSEAVYLGVFISLGSYFLGMHIKKRLKLAIFNPLLLAIVFTIVFLLAARMPYAVYYQGAKYISYLLTPATVCFAIPLYRQLHVLRRHMAAILVSIFAGSLTSVASIFLMGKLFGLPAHIHASLSPKSVTTPIATAIAEEMGGVVGCTVIAVIFTGILGAIFAASLKKLLRLKSDIAWGVATGTSSHAIGTSAVMEESEVAGAMGSLSIAIAGVMTVIIVPLLNGIY